MAQADIGTYFVLVENFFTMFFLVYLFIITYGCWTSCIVNLKYAKILFLSLDEGEKRAGLGFIFLWLSILCYDTYDFKINFVEDIPFYKITFTIARKLYIGDYWLLVLTILYIPACVIYKTWYYNNIIFVIDMWIKIIWCYCTINYSLHPIVLFCGVKKNTHEIGFIVGLWVDPTFLILSLVSGFFLAIFTRLYLIKLCNRLINFVNIISQRLSLYKTVIIEILNYM